MPESRAYHHGNLREALIGVSVELAREGGPDAVVLREASRRVGVSHNAAYRHFSDRDSLLRAVAERAMAELAGLMEDLIGRVDVIDPGEAARRRLRAVGTGYLTFATTEPKLFRTAFAVPDRLPPLDSDEGHGPSGLGPLGLLNRQLDELVATGQMIPERRPYAEIAAWSAVHGLSLLLVDGPLRDMSVADRAASFAALLDVVSRGLYDEPGSPQRTS